MPFRFDQGIWRTLGAARLKLFAEGNLFRAQAFLTVDGSPAWSRVAAAEELLIDAFVAGAAVSGGQMGTDYESMVIDLLLAGARLMAVKAIDPFFRVGRHLVFVNNRVLKPRMTFRAFSRCPNEVGSGLGRFNARTLSIDKKCRQNQRKRNDDCQKNRAKRHALRPPMPQKKGTPPDEGISCI
jgi:hypothetical protein